MAELLQLSLDGAAVCTSLSFVLTCKRDLTLSVYAVAMNYALVRIFIDVFLAFFHSCTWISVGVAKEVEREKIIIAKLMHCNSGNELLKYI